MSKFFHFDAAPYHFCGNLGSALISFMLFVVECVGGGGGGVD